MEVTHTGIIVRRDGVFSVHEVEIKASTEYLKTVRSAFDNYSLYRKLTKSFWI